MESTRAWTLGAVAVVVAVFGAGVVFGIEPQLAAASEADATAQHVATQNTAVRARLALLSRAAATESSLEATNTALVKSVPSSLKLNTFTRGLRDIAAFDQVTIVSVNPGTGVAYAAPESATPVAAATPAPTSSPAPTSAPAVAAPAAKSPWFGKTDSRITGANFSVVPVSVVVTGTNDSVLAYASDVQKAERLFEVSSVGTSTNGGVTTATLTGSIYALQR